MAHLPRTTKEGLAWTKNDLRAFNIYVHEVDATTFFGTTNLNEPYVDKVVLESEQTPETTECLPSNVRSFFYLMDDVGARTPPGQETPVRDFTKAIFAMLHYDSGKRYLRERREIPFSMAGGETKAHVDVCLTDRADGIILLAQERNEQRKHKDPEPQLIAGAIAAFKARHGGDPTAKQWTVPGVTMVGTVPTFYKIPVTQQLLEAVETARFPEASMRVEKLVPPVADRVRLDIDGMRTLNNRAVILSCYEAFKAFII